MQRLRDLVVVSLVCTPSLALAGGLFLPGSGAISTSRAGASVASADDGEALSVNPAGIAKARPGTTLTISAALINYSMKFTRTGTYDPIEGADRPYEGQPYQAVENDVSPPLALGSYQPVPVVAVVTDLGGKVSGLHLAAGLYAPNAYPFRDLQSDFTVDPGTSDPNQPPPPTRYDVLYQEAAVLLPSIAVAYRVTPDLDIGARFSFGFANLKSKVAIWGTPANVTEDPTHDAMLDADVSDGFVPVFGLGVAYRPAPTIELGAQWTSNAPIFAKGEAVATNGVNVTVDGNPLRIGPNINSPRCSPDELGDFEKQKICIQLELPMNATVGGRYKILGSKGELKGDIEANVQWERWGKKCDLTAAGDFRDTGCTSPGEYRIVTDASAYVGEDDLQDIDLGTSLLSHNLKDTFSLRLGGSYHIPLSSNTEDGAKVIIRGGLAHDTAAANEGWLRADIDGAARTTLALGGGYSAKRFEVNIGAGLIVEGSPENAGECNPVEASQGCSGTQRPLDQREGADPTFPLSPPPMQQEAPFNKGKYDASYVLFMLGVTAWF